LLSSAETRANAGAAPINKGTTGMQPPLYEKLGFEAPGDAEAAARARDFRALMRRRRTVRDFSNRPVPRALIEDAVMTAAGAPSGANQQPWTFACISDPAVKSRIRVAAEEEERAFYKSGKTPGEWLSALAPLGTDEHKPFLEIAPWLIVIFGQRYGVAADGSHVKHYYVPESVGIAMGFLIAALHSAGLATLTHTPSPMGFLNEICGRPPNEKPYVQGAEDYEEDAGGSELVPLARSREQEPDRDNDKHERNRPADRQTVSWIGKKAVQPSGKKHDGDVRQRRDRHENRGQQERLRKDRNCARHDEARQYADIEDSGLRVEQIGDQPAAKGFRVARMRFIGRCIRFVMPAVPGEPEKIEHARPAQDLIKQGRFVNERCDAERGGETIDRKPERDSGNRREARPHAAIEGERREIGLIRTRHQLDEQRGGGKSPKRRKQHVVHGRENNRLMRLFPIMRGTRIDRKRN
jgi:iodotyrosine deiodinase